MYMKVSGYLSVFSDDLDNRWIQNWRTSTMMTHKITPFVDYNKWLKRLDTQLIKPTNQNSINVFKVVTQTKKKAFLLNFWY